MARTVAKLLIVLICLVGLVAYVARGIFPGMSVVELIAITVGGLLLCAVVLTLAMWGSLQFRQWMLRNGGIDTQWLWFSSDPPGLDRQRKDPKQ